MRNRLIISMLFLLFSVSFVAFSANPKKTRVTLNDQNVSLEVVLNEIEKQTEFLFVSNSNDVDFQQKVTINVTNAILSDVLDLIFSNIGIVYNIEGVNIILSNRDRLSQDLSSAKGEDKLISGTIKDASGERVVGAGIIEKGTSNGTVSDSNGNFSLMVSPNSTITISCIGFTNKEIKVSEKDNYEITLEADVKLLDEVVVVGYGSIKKKDLTGAVSTISGDVLSERKTLSLSTSLQGAIPGLMVTRSSGDPSVSSSLRIRGITTIGDSSPLIIVDGVPVDNIDYVTANDVDNITVLKDAASASIYGSRAASGVILITTRRAQEDKLSIQYNIEYGFDKVGTHPHYVGPTRFMEMENELRWNDAGNGSNQFPTYSEEKIKNYYSLHAEDPDTYPITDWYDVTIDETAPRQSHMINLSGGTKKVKTKVSLGYDSVDGFYDHKSTKRYTVRFNNDINLNKYISASADVSFRRLEKNDAIINPFTDASGINYIPPIFAAYWKDGRYGPARDGGNCVAMVKEGGFDKNKHNALSGKISINIYPFEGLTITGAFSPTLHSYKDKRFKRALKYYDSKDPNLLIGYMSGFNATSLNETRNDSFEALAQFTATYIKSFREHNFNIMVGYEAYKSDSESLGAGRDNYTLDSYPYLNLGPLDYRTNSGSATQYSYRSYFGRILYNFKNKYLFQANIRFDGSSRFHKDHRWGTFPSASVGWVISEEPFFNQIRWWNYLKIRASLGNLGNERIGNYPYQSTIKFTNVPFISNGKVTSLQAAVPGDFVLQDISWEKTQSWDVGLDANFLNNRLKITADYYYKTTKDMLLSVEIPDYIGSTTNPENNVGKMHTRGFELDASWSDQIDDWYYSVSANISDFRSVMGDLAGTEFLGDKVKKKGSEFNEWYGYVSDGIYQTEQEVANSAVLNSSVRPGDIKYKDISGPDGIPDGKISPEYDRVLLGGSLPRLQFGGKIAVVYKNLDFSMSFQGVGKIKERKTQDMIRPLRQNWATTPKLIDGKYWSYYNTDEENKKAKYPRLTYSGGNNNYCMSDFWLFNGHYLRIKNITLGYEIPQKLVDKIKISGIRIYLSANDIFTISNYPDGWDPEMVNFGYPIAKSYIIGASINF